MAEIMIKRFDKTSARFVLSVILLCAFSVLMFATYGAGTQSLFERAVTFYAFADNHAWLLVGLYVLRLLFFLPASFVIFLTGMICGPLLGEVIAVAGLALGGSIEFLLVRRSVSSIFVRPSNAWLQKWSERISRTPFHSILLMRVCFVPFDAVNIVAAIARTPFRPFLFATVLGVIPTSLPIVVSGASINFDAWVSGGHLWPGEGAIHWTYLIFSVLLAALIALHARKQGFLRSATQGGLHDLGPVSNDAMSTND